MPTQSFAIFLLWVALLAVPGCVADEAALPAAPESLADHWRLVGEAINEPGYDVWGSSPIIGDDGRFQLFCARWPAEVPFEMGWRTKSEIARYVADHAEGPFAFAEVVAAGDGRGWDGQGYHNPNIQRVGDRYVLTHIANPIGWTNRNEHTPTQRIGMLVADSLEGPWEPANGDPDTPILAPPDDPTIWCHGSRVGVNNPALLAHPDGRFFLYFKAAPGLQGHVQMGVAIADKLEGPYIIQPEPITANDRGIEDGYAFLWRGHICLITTDNHGILDEGGGLLWVSRDGSRFEGQPLAGFHHFGRHYFPDGVPQAQRQHYGRSVKFERPQVLMIDGEPGYLYVPSGNAVDGSDGTNCYVLRFEAQKK